MSQLTHFQNGVLWILSGDEIKTGWGTPTREWDIDDVVLKERPYTVDREEHGVEHISHIPDTSYIWYREVDEMANGRLKMNWIGNTEFENAIRIRREINHSYYEEHPNETPFGFLRSYFRFNVLKTGDILTPITLKITCKLVIWGHEIDPSIENKCFIFGWHHDSEGSLNKLYSYNGSATYVNFSRTFVFTPEREDTYVWAHLDLTGTELSTVLEKEDYMYLDMKLEKL